LHRDKAQKHPPRDSYQTVLVLPRDSYQIAWLVQHKIACNPQRNLTNISPKTPDKQLSQQYKPDYNK
jgi:hypothetical protein